jgi:RNA polymerase sigma-70 factor (ECF subfamily)
MTPLLAQRPRADRSFERLYRRHVADVYHYALAVLRNPSDAEDVTQTTFLNAYRAYQRGERPQAPQNWLIAIAHNVCRQRFRQSTRRPLEVAFDEDVADAIADDDAPSAQDIRRALGHLAFNQRAALVMRELEGRTYAEIGEILGLSVSAVETLIFRARRALREQLDGALTCGEAELAISRQVDGRLPRGDRGALRAHLRECPECATFARSQRAQRSAFKALGAVPLPASLSSFSSLFGGGGGAAVGTAVATKAAAVLAAGALAGGVGYEGAKHTLLAPSQKAAPTEKAPAASASARSVVRPSAAPAKAAPKHAAEAKRVGKAKASAAHAKPARKGPSSTQHGRSVSRLAKSHGAPQRTRARGSPARRNSATAPRGSGSSRAKSSHDRGKPSGHAVVKAPSVRTVKPKPSAPAGRGPKTAKTSKPTQPTQGPDRSQGKTK